MNLRQQLLRVFYPVILWTSSITGRKAQLKNASAARPTVPIYDFEVRLLNGQVKKLKEFEGKKMLIVNTASDCGYTHQLEALQTLSERYRNELVVLGFPSNDFRNQEPGTDAEIEKFCTITYHTSFPLSVKSVVLDKPGQHPVFKWLSEKGMNGWNSQLPKWNFSKYLVNENGNLTHYFDAGFDPLGREIINAIEKD